MDLTQCINYLLTTAQHTVVQHLNSKLLKYDVTPSQYGVLSCLWRCEYSTPKQIAESLFLETSTISGILDRMQKKGLIQRVMNLEDKREVRIVLTEKGKDLEIPLSDIIEAVNLEVLQGFSEEQILEFKESLMKIIEHGKKDFMDI